MNKMQYIEKFIKIHNNKYDYSQLYPNFNKVACKVFDEISLKENIHIQHAMNGGEYYIKELGYWVDGYDKKIIQFMNLMKNFTNIKQKKIKKDKKKLKKF